MKRPEDRHYTEEELLLASLEEGPAEARRAVDSHMDRCRECSAVWLEYRELRNSLALWSVPAVSEETWEARKTSLLRMLRHGEVDRPRGDLWRFIRSGLENAWEYALNNPLPTLGYIAAAIAFASERTITLFRLDEVLPATGEFFEILRRVL